MPRIASEERSPPGLTGKVNPKWRGDITAVRTNEYAERRGARIEASNGWNGQDESNWEESDTILRFPQREPETERRYDHRA